MDTSCGVAILEKQAFVNYGDKHPIILRLTGITKIHEREQCTPEIKTMLTAMSSANVSNTASNGISHSKCLPNKNCLNYTDI